MNKILLIYPPGKPFQRGEDRCQINLDDCATQNIRACNDLGYAAAVLKKKNYEIQLKDYQSEKLSDEDLFSDIKTYNPDLILISTTNTTIFDDLALIKKVKEFSRASIVLKGAIFYAPEKEMLKQLDLTDVDVLIGGEIDFIIDKVADYLLKGEGNLTQVPSILYKDKNEEFTPTEFNNWDEDLDKQPFPARHLMNNSLYVRPDTGEVMATIQTARGCPSECIFCITPQISGKKIRLRSPQNIMEELFECYEKYNIKNFFFRADSFTFDEKWVNELCTLIINSKLWKKIQFTANGRVKPLKKETLQIMKKAGCFTIAFGFESGSEETMKKIKKGATLQDNKQAMSWAKEIGLPVLGMFMIGFPWEDKTHIEDTKKLIYELEPDFIEITLALPFYGTQLYDICLEQNLVKAPVYGSDFFNASLTETTKLTTSELLEIRKNILLSYYLRPKYIFKKVINTILKPKVLLNYFKYGFRLLITLLTKGKR